MEGKKRIWRLTLVPILLLFSVQVSLAQSDHTDRLYEAYARGKMDVWFSLMQEFEEENDFSSSDKKLELVNLYYGYAAWLVGAEQDDLAEIYIEKSEGILDQILEKEPDNSTAMAYKGAFIAFEIGISNYKAIYLGMASMQYIEDAFKLDSINIQANIEMGNSSFYSPPAFGGDKSSSIAYYQTAARQMEVNNLVEKNWMYLNVMTALGMAYEATGQIQHAKLCYEKILVVKPNFMWVGEELYP
ncbi:MAG: tetratricopeptide (TPR) repeat protein, partial [Flavobacteriales bacterium]